MEFSAKNANNRWQFTGFDKNNELKIVELYDVKIDGKPTPKPTKLYSDFMQNSIKDRKLSTLGVSKRNLNGNKRRVLDSLIEFQGPLAAAYKREASVKAQKPFDKELISKIHNLKILYIKHAEATIKQANKRL